MHGIVGIVTLCWRRSPIQNGPHECRDWTIVWRWHAKWYGIGVAWFGEASCAAVGEGMVSSSTK